MIRQLHAEFLCMDRRRSGMLDRDKATDDVVRVSGVAGGVAIGRQRDCVWSMERPGQILTADGRVAPRLSAFNSLHL